ncbi:MAG: hypothetical protein HZA68_01580 [Rhodovulum sp.]|nr:hypothetical protein [Rhodovulum sp.]
MDAQTTAQPSSPSADGTGDVTARLPLRPALLAPYRDLVTLRHDYPLVLVQADDAAAAVRPLTAIVDDILRTIAPRGAAGERTRRHVLALEQEIRRRVAAGAGGHLVALWDAAAAALITADPDRAEALAAARAALAIDGDVIGCDGEAPARVVTHLWEQAEAHRLTALADRIATLRERLEALLAGDTPARAPLTEPRARRIRAVLDRLVPPARFDAVRAGDPTALADLVTTDPAAAIAACRRETAAIVDLAAALTIATLDCDGRYDESRHDDAFAAFSVASLTPDDLALAPAVLLRLDDDGPARRGEVLDILAAGLPIKILVRSSDPLGDAGGDAAPGRALPGTRLATMAAGIEDAFVLQAGVDALAHMASRIARGLAYDGPALLAIQAGGAPAGLPSYLQAAVVGQARLMPSFCYDPSAGPDLASRWSVADHNPQPGADWWSQPFVYEQDGHRVVGTVALTAADPLVCDPRLKAHVRLVPASAWTDAMVPLDQWLAADAADPACIPYVAVIDADDRLLRAVPSPAVIAATSRCRDAWRSLQELGGLHNSWAEQRLAEARETWEEERSQLLAAHKAAG